MILGKNDHFFLIIKQIIVLIKHRNVEIEPIYTNNWQIFNLCVD